MKGKYFVICALLGVALADEPEKEQYYDDSVQYQDTQMQAFLEQNTKQLEQFKEAEAKAAPKPVVAAPVAKPIPAPKPEALKKKEEKKKTKEEIHEEMYPHAPQALAESELTAENLGKKDMETEWSNNLSDGEYLQIKNKEGRFAFLVNNIQGPEDLNFIQPNEMSFLQIGAVKEADDDGQDKKTPKLGTGWHGRTITDNDGDGVEDNKHLESEELDPFYDPFVYGVAEDIHNTWHGHLPGHKQYWQTKEQTEPPTHRQDIIKAPWVPK